MLSHRTGAQVLRLGPTTQWHTAQRIFIETGSKMHGTQPLRGCLQGCYGACRGGLMQHTGYELPRITVPRLYEKSSSAGETPPHEADHGSVHQRLAART